MATKTTTIKFVGQFDSSGITKGLQEIKKQITSSNISEELKKQLQDSFSKVEVNLPKLDKFMKKEDFNLKELAEYQKLVQEITKDMTNFSKVANEADFTKNFSEQDTARLKKFDEQIKQVDDKLKATKKEIINTFAGTTQGKIGGKSSNALNGVIEQLLNVPEGQIENKLNEIIKEAENQTENARNKLQEVFQKSSRGKNLKAQGIIDLLFGKNSGVTMSEAAKDRLTKDNGVYAQFDKIRQEILSFTKDTPVEKVEETLKSLSKFINEFFKVPEGKESVLGTLLPKEVIERIKTLATDIPGLKAILGKDKLQLIADGEAEKLRLTQEQAAELKKIIEGLTQEGIITRGEADNLIKKFTGLGGAIENTSDAAKNLDNQQKALSATFSTLANRIKNSISALTIFNRSIQIVRQAVNSVRELDAAFTQIAIVSEQSNEQAWQMFDSFNKLAKQYSITTKDLTEGAKLFYQQGLNAADTMKMVEASTISAALGEVSMSEAANTLTAAIQGYNESAAVAMDYTDKIAMVGAVSAADFNELSAAMEKTASSAYTAGIDFDHLLGYLGKMIEVTREAPANLGTAMKTIIARFEDMKKDPAALIDGASANKVEAALATIGIALRDTAGEFRPLQDVFDELGMSWKNLTRNQQAYIATVAAGSRQQSRFLAMMNNYPRTLELIRESQNSAGAALRQYETYQNSAAAASARLTASWENFYSKIADSKMIVDVINNLTKLVEVMSKIGPTWTAAIATIGAHGINKIITGDLISKTINFFGQNITSSAGKKLTLTIGSVLKDGIKFGMKEAFNKFEPGDFEGFKNAFAAAGQEGAKGLLAGVGKIGIAIGGIVPELLIIAGIIAAILLTIKAISSIIDYNNKAIERELLATSKLAKEDAERYEKKKKEKNIIEDNYKIYEKYKDIIVLTDEELEEQNKAVDAIKEQYDDLVIITDEYGRKIINNTDDLIAHNNKLKEDTKELERQVALNKLIAIQQSENSEKKYGKGNKTFMQDWTVEQLTNSGFNLEEAEVLDAYGEMYRNKNKRGGTFWDFAGAAFNFGGREYLKNDSLYNQIVNDLIGTGQFKWATRGTFVNSQSEWGELIAENVETILNADKEELERIVNLSLTDLDDKGKAYTQVIQKYAQIALDAQKILEKQAKESAKSILISTIDDIEYGLNDSILQNDVYNLYSNLGSFNNNSLIEQLIGDETDPKAIEDKMKSIGEAINNYVNNLNPADQKSFHDLSEKLLDPSLSPNKKRELVEKFRIDANGISDEVDKILDQFVEGTNYDIKRREKLSQALGIIDTNFMRQFNSSQLRIIDQLRTANKNTTGMFSFDFGSYIQTDAGKKMIKMLSSLETDITKDPTIYKKAQDIMINFFKQNFALNDKEAFDTFQEMFGNLPELALDAAESNFSNAKDLILTEPTKALSKKQTEAYQQLEGILGNSLRSYIEINEQGEEYLTIAGKIAIFEKTAEEYRNALIADGDNYISQMEQIFAISEKNEKNEYILTKEQKKRIESLEHEIELNSKKLEQLDKIKKYTTQVTAETANISMAKNYNNNLKVFKQAEDEMKKFNGVMNNDTAAAIMAMDASYARYLNKRLVGEDYYYTITEDGMKNLRAEERKNYNLWIEEQKGKLQDQIDILDAELKYFQAVVDAEGILSEEQTQKEFDDKVKALDGKLENAEQELEGEVQLEEDKNKEILIGAKDTATQFHSMWSASYSALRTEWNELADAMANNRSTNSKESPKLVMPEIRESPTNSNLNTPNKPIGLAKNKAKEISQKSPKSQEEIQNEKNKKTAQEQIDRIKAVLERLQLAKDALVPLGPELDDVSSGSNKTDDSMKKLTSTLKDLADALEDLDKLLKDVKRDFQDINVDYSPFLDRLEEWEHEWDYFYNIKRLISELDTKGTFIDNIISAGYTSADEKDQARKAKMGNILAKMSANDAYITALRAGMAKTGVEVMEQYGDYYKINPETGQIYQTDKNLNDINKTINEKREEIYNLQKQQNEKENDLNLENAKLEALEEEKSAYEDILSTIDSQIDSLEDNEDITADLTELLGQKTEIQAKIDVTQGSIDDAKEKIKNMEDEIQNIEVQITLEERDEQDLENYVDKMEEKVDEYQQYWENVNSTIAEQQALLQQLYEMRQYYVDTAIQTEQELYNAIVENYQNEINEKKKQYDYLKKLDQDYLNSIKNNISKERQLREDANKQRSYQQSLQRARLLQMDTSGAYRNDLADLNKQIESQRQDLYDDLIDKQYDALEKEINKRHELYDKETTALDERLKYMQENAILLWEQVNGIVNQGTNAMMATLENTNNYINSNELSRMEQRSQWENNVKTTYEGVEQGYIGSVSALINAGKDFVDNTYPEINAAVTTMASNFDDAIYSITTAASDLSSGIGDATSTFSGIINKFMQEWDSATYNFTGYSESWSTMVQQLKESTSSNLSKISGYYDEEGKARENLLGSINKYAESLSTQSSQIYNDFIDERQKYRDELDGVIKQIQEEISASIISAGTAIQNAANSIQFSAPQQPATDTSGGSGGPTGPGGTEPTGPGGGEPRGTEQHFKAEINSTARDSYTGRTKKVPGTLSGYTSREAAKSAAEEYIRRQEQALRDEIEEDFRKKNKEHLIPNIQITSQGGFGIYPYKQGGLASFTGLAWLDGTKSNPERVLSPKQTKLFESMVSSLEHVSLNNSNINSALGSSYNIGDINTSINVEKLDNETDIEKVARQVENRIMKSIRNRVSIAIA